MNFFYGIRPTGNNLHLGHVASLLSMFEDIVKQSSEISCIYILMADTHAEISKLPCDVIKTYSKQLANKIYALLRTYLSVNNVEEYVILDKIKFIFQTDNVGVMHRDLAYRYLPLLSLNDLTTNPIFKNSDNNTVGFLVYPVLQAFDILMYTEDYEETWVYVASDQQANINLAKDIYTKLQCTDKIKFDISTNVIYSGDHKMSKSLNNFVDFDDIDGIKDFVLKHITCNRPTKTTVGDFEGCPTYKQIFSRLQNYFRINMNSIDKCNTGDIGCIDCKNEFIKQIMSVIEKYIHFQTNSEDFSVDCIRHNDIIERYTYLSNVIDETRSKM